MKFKIGQKVKILAPKKTDGRYNYGVIVGIKSYYDGLYIITEKQFIKSIKVSSYQIAYVDCFTNRGCLKWVVENNIEKSQL